MITKYHILELLKERYDFSFKEISNKLKVKDLDLLKDLITKLIYEGRIIETDENRYTLISNTPFRLAEVTSKHTSYLFATLLIEKTDVKLSSQKSFYLLPGDLIYVEILNTNSNNVRYVAPLKEIDEIKGNYLILNDKVSLKLLTNSDFNYKIEVTNQDFVAKANDLVLAKINSRDFSYSTYELKLNVTILKVLNKSDEIGFDITNILASYSCPIEFNKEVIKELENIKTSVSEEEIKLCERKDYRNTTVVTIDGDDALDFDDAISISKNKNGSYVLTVHIADVSHYVKENSALDEEAKERGNSIYVADRVVPMLPEKLSNDICSLNPNVDRLTLSTEMVIDADGNCIYSKIYRGVIRSRARLTYKEVNEFIHSSFEKHNFSKEVAEMLKIAYECHKKIRRRRELNNTLKIETSEIKFLLDENGFPTRVSELTQDEGEKLIEDFMITTNVEVAKKLDENNIVGIYRVHDRPPLAKIELLKAFLKKLNLLKFFPRDITSEKLNQFIESIEDPKVKELLNKFLIKTMAKAEYSIENSGHFGLNEDCYLHFTSPIRRYPDLTVHRCIKHYLIDNKGYQKSILENILFDVAVSSSFTERRAQQIEYEVNDLLTCKYLSNKIGYKYHATIDGITNFGFYIKLDIGLEGFLPYDNMLNKKYIFNEKRYETYVQDSTDIYSFGDSIDVKVLSVDFERRQVIFELVSNEREELKKENKTSEVTSFEFSNKKNSKGNKPNKFNNKETYSQNRKDTNRRNNKDHNFSKKKSSYKESRSFSKNKERRKEQNFNKNTNRDNRNNSQKANNRRHYKNSAKRRG